uniref:Mobilization protein n=1 Tax=uncultured prokaryote TaxID=198431 RepID=A0A0H5PW76_9ZZZZ|nr:hypothetical protein [uncultured prokaryote]
MSKIGAVHFNPKIQPHLQHNDRTNSNADNIVKELSHLNECDKTAKEALKEIDKLYKEAMIKLDEAKKKGKRTPKERSFHEAIFEIDEYTTMEQCQQLADEIAELTGFRKIQITIHRDEGHTDNGEWKPHYHAHAVFFTLDKETGKQLARQEQSLNPRNLSKMQDLASKTLKMNRGNKSYREDVYQRFLTQKNAKNELIKIKYKPQAPLRIQNQDDFKRFKEQMKEKELELETQTNQIKRIAKEQARIQQELKEREFKLQEKEKDFQKRIREIEQGHKNTFIKLSMNFENQKSFIKNILTLGRHNKKIDKNKEQAIILLRSSTEKIKQDEAKRHKQIITELERIKEERDAYQSALRATKERKNELEIKNAKLNNKILELKKKYEPETIQQNKIHKQKNNGIER